MWISKNDFNNLKYELGELRAFTYTLSFKFSLLIDELGYRYTKYPPTIKFEKIKGK